MVISRTWAMPSKATFDVQPIGDFVYRYTANASLVIDPFSNGRRYSPHGITNDLNPEIEADYHLDVHDFLKSLNAGGTVADVVVFDPPYSPRQISECYNGIGRKPTQHDTQRPGRWKPERDLIAGMQQRGGVVLTFGWSSVGMGKNRGYDIEEILLVAHGSAHNDTICVAERKITFV